MGRTVLATCVASIGVMVIAVLAMEMLIAWSTVDIGALASPRVASHSCRAMNDRLLPHAPGEALGLFSLNRAPRPLRRLVAGGRSVSTDL